MKLLPEESKELNKRLQNFRKEAHIQQQEMADYCGLSKNYLSAMERGINKCNAHVLISYARKLNVSLDELTGLTSERPEETIIPDLKNAIAAMSHKDQEKLLEIINILNR
nr:helix-turn-helix transcriptional regulator [uncultured Blautia sp.]